LCSLRPTLQRLCAPGYSPLALARFRQDTDLEQIADYIAADNPMRALSFVGELRKRCKRLADIPKGLPLLPRYEHVGIRSSVDATGPLLTP